MSGRRTCRTKGCGGELIEGRLVCQACWRRLPPDLRNEVFQAWQHGDRAERLNAAANAFRWLRDNPAACDAAR